jgi:GTP-binding protein
LPRILLFGRANTGKSTIFNRLAGRQQAITHPEPGTTRDLLTATIVCGGYRYTLVDAAGYEPLWEEESARRARLMLDRAIGESDLILFVLDAAMGPTALDMELAEHLRKSQTPVLVVANKSESSAGMMQAHDANRLGLGEPVLVAALHRQGLAELRRAIAARLPGAPLPEETIDETQEEDKPLAIAIVGKVNVGKSSLVNALIGTERLIISEVPGTTHDAVDVSFSFNNTPIMLVDTAGMRKRAKVGGEGLERETVKRALAASQRADVICLVMDATKGAQAQDASIAEYCVKLGKPLVLVVNKWDLSPAGKNPKKYEQAYLERLKFATFPIVLFVSALTKQRIGEILPACIRAHAAGTRRIATAELNEMLTESRSYFYRGREIKIQFMTQVKISPPTFAVWINDKDGLHFSHLRNLENRIREKFDFLGTPIRLLVKVKKPRQRLPRPSPRKR